MRAEPVYEDSRRIKRSLAREAVREPQSLPSLVQLRSSAGSVAPSGLRALQRTSGNRAVGLLLRRQPLDTTKADARTIGTVSATIIMDDPIGVMPLVSFSREKESEVTVVVPSTTLDGELMRYMVQGIKQKLVTISTASFNLKLDEVLIMSFERSGSDEEATVQMTLSFDSQHLK